MKLIIATTIAAAAIFAIPANAQDMFQTMEPAKTARAYDLNPNDFQASGDVKKAESHAADPMRKFKTNVTSKLKDLEAEDKLGNFEIQDLMSSFNQSQTLASNVQKKNDDTKSAVIGKI